jgi:hypothetical protein
MDKAKVYAIAMAVIGLLTCAAAIVGAEPPKPEEKADLLVPRWLKVCFAHAQDYRIHPVGKPDNVFKLLPTPVFRHSAPVRGSDDIGAVWLWVGEDGRPAVVGTVFTYSGGAGGGGYRFVAHEFHSLYEEPLEATWRGRMQWSPKQAGVDWKPIPSAPAPAASPAERLRQMGELARQFQGHEFDFKNSRWELRLVTKPVYRYELKKTDMVQDGTLFFFCQGTDPEIVLGIEARRVANGYQWHYSSASFSDYEVHLRHHETEVWAPPRGTPNDRTASHWWYGRVERTRLPEGDETTAPPSR